MDDIDQIAQQVATEAKSTDTGPDLARMLAWRDGQLSETEAAEVERQLVHDPIARTFLAESTTDAPPFLTRWAQSQRPTRRRWWIAGVGVAAAALLAVFLWRSPSNVAPDYTIAAIRGGHAEVRGHAVQAGPVEVDAESTLTVALTPKGERVSSPNVRVFVVYAGKHRAAAAQVTTGDGGAIRLILAASIFDVVGAYTVRIALGDDLSALPARDDPGVEWLEFAVRRVE